MRIRTFLKPLSFLPAIFLMYMIFTFSSMEADLSTSVSYKASVVLVKAADSLFDMGLDDYQISYFSTKINGVTRKLAHMTEFFALAIAVSFPLYVYGLRGILLMILAGGFCIAFACGDEYHQSFVAGRSPSSKDVLIDSIGVFIGIIFVRIVGWTGRMTLFRPIREKEESPQMQEMPKMSRKEKKQWKKQMKAMKKAGYDPEQFQNGPYSNGVFQNNGYNGQPYGGPGQNGNYPQGNYQNISYQQSGCQNRPYPNEPYQNGSYSNEAFQSNGYNDQPYGGPYQNDNYQNGSYPQGNYQNSPYQQGGFQNGPYPQGGYGAYPYPPQAPQYMGQDPEEDYSSDDLAEDMPLSHLLKPRK